MHAEGYYIIIDCPGQVELFTLRSGLQNVIKALTDRLHIRYCKYLLMACQSLVTSSLKQAGQSRLQGTSLC